MRRSYHVKLSLHAGHEATHASHDTYELARDHAKSLYSKLTDGAMIEVVHMSVIVWGPYTVGGKYVP